MAIDLSFTDRQLAELRKICDLSRESIVQVASAIDKMTTIPLRPNDVLDAVSGVNAPKDSLEALLRQAVSLAGVRRHTKATSSDILAIVRENLSEDPVEKVRLGKLWKERED